MPSSAPVRPNKPRSLLSSVFVGLAVGVVLALLVDSLDETVWTKEELAYFYAGLPVLAEFPPLRTDTDTHPPLRWYQAASLSDADVALLDVAAAYAQISVSCSQRARGTSFWPSSVPAATNTEPGL